MRKLKKMYVNGDVKDDIDETLTTCINREFEKLKKIISSNFISGELLVNSVP